jgi:hypothetical protein
MKFSKVHIFYDKNDSDVFTYAALQDRRTNITLLYLQQVHVKYFFQSF